MSIYDSFDDLMVGETVIIHRSVYGSNEYQTATVAKLSKTQFAVTYSDGKSDSFMIRTGKRVGDGDAWHPYYAMRYTTENIQRMKRVQERRRLAIVSYMNKYNWNALTLDALQNIKAQLEAITQEAA